MTGNIVHIRLDSTLLDTQDVMIKPKLTRLVVTNRVGKLRGIITRRDIVRLLNADKTER